MSISAATVWRIRAGGNDANGGGYDTSISGSGTDYTDQDAAQLSLIDIVTIGSTTVTSVTGGFTSAMVGNALLIGSDGYYFITARASSTSITVDRNTGTGIGQTGKVGGAWATFTNMLNGGNLPQPSPASPLVPGNKVMVRGAGSNTPSTDDYTLNSGQYGSIVNGDTTNGRIHVIGYNGRPRINYGGLLGYHSTQITFENLYFFLATSATYAGYGMMTGGDSAAINVYIDVNGNGSGGQCIGISAVTVIDCWVFNSGTKTSVSTGSAGIFMMQYAGACIGNKVQDQRQVGIQIPNSVTAVTGNLIIGNATDGIYLQTNSGGYGGCVAGNTLDSNGGNGVTISDIGSSVSVSIINNIFSNQGGYDVAILTGSAAAGGRTVAMVDYNVHYNATSGAYLNVTGGSHEVTANPSYTGGGNYTPTNVALAGTALPTSFP